MNCLHVAAGTRNGADKAARCNNWNWTRKAGNPLESCRIGGRIVTSREAVQRFLEQQNQGADQ